MKMINIFVSTLKNIILFVLMKRLFSLEESNVENGRIEVDELEYENLNNKGNIS